MGRTIRVPDPAEIRKHLTEINPKACTADGFDDALIGIVYRKTMDPIALYDRDRCIEVLMKDGMDEEEAAEFFEFNVSDAWVGDGTPAFLL